MDETADVLGRYVAAWNDQDGDRLAALYYPDAERASPLGTARSGTDIRAAAERIWRAALPDRGAGVLELHDGRIAAERLYLDPGAFLRQLGLSR